MSVVRWSAQALRDLDRLHRFLKPKSPQAASRAIAAIRQATRTLAQYPALAQPRPDGLRDHYAPFGASAYVLRYRLDPAGDVFIIRVWHAREDREHD